MRPCRQSLRNWRWAVSFHHFSGSWPVILRWSSESSSRSLDYLWASEPCFCWLMTSLASLLTQMSNWIYLPQAAWNSFWWSNKIAHKTKVEATPRALVGNAVYCGVFKWVAVTAPAGSIALSWGTAQEELMGLVEGQWSLSHRKGLVEHTFI